jgi:hypothetical protein
MVYEVSLGESKPQRIVYDTAMKIQWQMSQKDEIRRFLAEISAHSISINMLLAIANV